MATINGSSGDDTLVGTPLSDIITPLTGRDTVDGGAGRDRLIIDYSALRVSGSILFGPETRAVGTALEGSLASVVSTDRISFSNIEDLDITFGSGRDRFFFRADNALQRQTVSVNGGGDFDSLVLTLYGVGDARFRLGSDGTMVSNLGLRFSNFEQYVISLGAGNHTVVTGGGSDTVRTEDGNSTISAGDGDDGVYLGTGVNSVSLGAGNDVTSSRGGTFFAAGGDGEDVLTFTASPTDASTLAVNAGVARLGTTLNAREFEQFNITLGSAADRVSLIDTRADIVGGDGDDVFNVVRPRSVEIDGGGGYDSATFSLGSGNAIGEIRSDPAGGFSNAFSFSVGFTSIENLTITMGSGNDLFTANVSALAQGARMRVDGGAGSDTLSLDFSGLPWARTSVDASGTLTIRTGVFSGFESASLIGSPGNDILFGLAGGNMIDGGKGHDVIHASLGNDTLYGGEGWDTFHIAGGNDTVYGGPGNDTYYIASGANATVSEYSREGTDTVYTADGGGFGVERIFLTGSADAVITGFGGANLLVGNSGNNVLYAEEGNDELQGGEGFDQLFGGTGKDVLIGGAGGDYFRFDTLETSAVADEIRDFIPGEDAIDLFRSVFTAFEDLPQGSNPVAAFVAGTAATTAAHHLIYDRTTGNLSYDPDGVGGEAQILIAILTTKPDLAATDIFLS